MKKSVLWIVIFVIVAFGLLYLGGVFKEGGPKTPRAPQVAVPPTGNIDDVTAAILGEVGAGEEMTPVDSDPTLTAPDDAIIGGFDQSFNASQF